MSPLKRYNKVVPSPQKQCSQTPWRADDDQMCRPFTLQSSSESSLLEKENGDGNRTSRPGSAPLHKDQRRVTHSTGPPRLVSASIQSTNGMVEIHGQATGTGMCHYACVCLMHYTSFAVILALASCMCQNTFLYTVVVTNIIMYMHSYMLLYITIFVVSILANQL